VVSEKRAQQLASLRAELVVDPLTTWRFPVGNLHAARIINEDAEKVLLRDNRRDDEHRAGETEHQHGKRTDA
jgi:hypothetical protein